MVDDPLEWLLTSNPDDRFKSLFRMSKHAFIQVLNLIERHPIFQNNSTCPQAHPSIQLAVFLYRVGASGTSTVRTSMPLGVGDGTVHLYFRRVCTALLSLSSENIVWPRGQQMEDVKARICKGTDGDFEDCCGFIDGSVIPF